MKIIILFILGLLAGVLILKSLLPSALVEATEKYEHHLGLQQVAHELTVLANYLETYESEKCICQLLEDGENTMNRGRSSYRWLVGWLVGWLDG